MPSSFYYYYKGPMTKTRLQKAILKDYMLLNYYEVLSEVQDIYGICVCSLIGFEVYSNMLMFNYHCPKKELQFYFLFYPQLCHILKFEESFNLLTYSLTPWSRVLLEKLTSKLCR